MSKELSKEEKQRNLFKAIYEIAKKGKTIVTLDGEAYKQAILNIAPKNLEEIKQWSEEEDKKTLDFTLLSKEEKQKALLESFAILSDYVADMAVNNSPSTEEEELALEYAYCLVDGFVSFIEQESVATEEELRHRDLTRRKHYKNKYSDWQYDKALLTLLFSGEIDIMACKKENFQEYTLVEKSEEEG